MLVFLRYVTMAASDVDSYVGTRRAIVHPTVRQQSGYGGEALLKPRTDSDAVRLALLNWWTGAEGQERWAGTAAHSEMKDRTSRLIRSVESSVYEHAGDLSLRIGDPAAAAMCSIGFHQVQPGRSPDYVSARRDVANPSMRKAAGFVGISVGTDPGDADRFLTFFEWADDAKADEYYASAEHVDAVYPAIAGVLTALEPSERYDVLMRHVPRLDWLSAG
jgi:heme-degrading monooxygenase HmoA